MVKERKVAFPVALFSYEKLTGCYWIAIEFVPMESHGIPAIKDNKS